MQKNNNLQKFLTASFIVLSFLFVLLFLLLVFNKSIGESFVQDVQGNKLIHVIVISMAVLYFANALGLIKLAFIDREKIDAITIINSTSSATKVEKKTVYDIVKHNTKFVEGVSVKGINIKMTDKNTYKLEVSIKVQGVEHVDHVIECFRHVLFNAFSEILGIEFASIDFKVEVRKPKYTPDMETIESEMDSLEKKRSDIDELAENLKEEEEEMKKVNLDIENEKREKEIESLSEEKDDEDTVEIVEEAEELQEETTEETEAETTEEVLEENEENIESNKGDEE